MSAYQYHSTLSPEQLNDLLSKMAPSFPSFHLLSDVEFELVKQKWINTPRSNPMSSFTKMPTVELPADFTTKYLDHDDWVVISRIMENASSPIVNYEIARKAFDTILSTYPTFHEWKNDPQRERATMSFVSAVDYAFRAKMKNQ
jgi:hypothetical protein